jgi:exosortase E/protease (VPEID-CTERM system)
MVAEAVAVGVRYEGVTEAFGGGRWWSILLARGDDLFKFFLVSATAFLVFGGWRLVAASGTFAPADARPWQVWPFALAHLAAFAAFFRMTGAVLEEGAADSPAGNVFMVGWAVLALATLAFWIATLVPVPARAWVSLLARGWGPLAGGFAVGVSAWVAGEATRGLWRPLNGVTFGVVLAMLRVVVPQTVADPETFRLGTPSFSVTINPTCSGYEGIGLIGIVLGAFLWVYRRDFRFPQALVLFPVGMLLIGLANCLRIAALVVIGTRIAPAIALGGFHSQAGWIAFLAVSLGLFAVARRTRFLRVADAPGEVAAGPNPATPYLAPLFAILATAMLTGAFTDGFDGYYPLRVLTATAVFWSFRDRYRVLGWSWPWDWDWSWPPLAIGTGVFVLWMALEPAAAAAVSDVASSATERGVLSLPLAWSTTWVVFRVVGSVVTVPLAEELAFRGYLLRRLVAAEFETVPARRFTGWSVVASSLLFGVVHGRWLAGTLAGLAYSVAFASRGKLGSAVLAHATSNALIAAWVLAMGHWSLWE